MRFFLTLISLVFFPVASLSQVKWENVDSDFGPLPPSVHVYRSSSPLDGKPNIAYYVEADLRDRNLLFEADTSLGRRLKPSAFYEKNGGPLLVVNTTFFSFATNQNLNVVVKDGELVSYNIHSLAGRGRDTLTYRHPFGSAIGISKKRKADVAWLYTDSSMKHPYGVQFAPPLLRNREDELSFDTAVRHVEAAAGKGTRLKLKKWKMQTAVGGGPVLVQDAEVRVTNNEENKFAGKAIHDKHPRTAMGYTKDKKLIILVIAGRNPGVADGASLLQEAEMLRDIGCVEALNLDGGGSSCMLVNGKETIPVSDKGGQRAVPAVLMIRVKGR